ncbi:MAG: hypothetical protein WGN25_07080 [Candidatus Electrothrix sp. GW3-4]|uniref:hypothetical protein n=1 Tax=Candidatus Electrothrix sp. GW3-4 TaxID=3126740 RepID=UPI0030D3DEFC
MKVANPLYDVVFKYLMQDMRVAKLVISNIIEQEMEDEILEQLATQERVIAYERAEKEKAEVEKRKAEAEKEKAEAEAEKDRLEKLLKQAGIEF